MRIARILAVGVLTLALGGLAIASVKQDLNAVHALNQSGATFGWSVDYLWPPDPCLPPDPCKVNLRLNVDADSRADLDQTVVFRHNEGGLINPCVRVLHQVFSDGSMGATINLLDADASFHVTVPAGYELVRDASGAYVLAVAP